MRPGIRILITCCSFLLSLAIGLVCYRGPKPLGVDAAASVPSASRMRSCLVELLGEQEAIHSAGTKQGEAFLQRLTGVIESYGVTTTRIDFPWSPTFLNGDQSERPDWVPPELVLKNLLATVPGKDPDLAPILIATHHDSCRFGPGAGDAGSALVALVENLRILSESQPLRTTHFLFTDGEEFGLYGAKGIAEMEHAPFEEPAFVLNLDARGTTGGVPMFETHEGNDVAVGLLINHLARPKITSSLAVTVYRTLPRMTDFDVWSGTLGYAGFNYATIGGAHHYHQPSDTPENLSNRTLQHMGNHVFEMHRALDVETLEVRSDEGSNAVFFDLLGLVVVSYGPVMQQVLAVVSVCLLAWMVVRRREGLLPQILKLSFCAVVTMASGMLVGSLALGVLWNSPWSSSHYTPVDLWVGLMVICCGFIASTMTMEWLANRFRLKGPIARVWFWLPTSVLGMLLAWVLPGGAYLVVLPCFVFAVTGLLGEHGFGSSRVMASWCGWITMLVLVGPLLTLLVQATGPWLQHLYGLIAGGLSVLGTTTWYCPFEVVAGGTDSAGVEED